MTKELITQLMGAWLLVTLSAITIWDLALFVFNGDTPSVSLYLWQLGQKNPVLYLLLGVSIGHLIIPLVVRPK